jgi:hypothetical protein
MKIERIYVENRKQCEISIDLEQIYVPV